MAARPRRYTMDAVRFEIAKMRDDLDLQDKDVYMGAGISQSAFSKKMGGGLDFSLDELSAIADFFSQAANRSLPGWPFLSSKECVTIEKKLPDVYGPPHGSASSGHVTP